MLSRFQAIHLYALVASLLVLAAFAAFGLRPLLQYSPRWKSLRVLYPRLTTAAELVLLALAGFVLYRSFRDRSNPLAWVVTLPLLAYTAYHMARYLWHRHTSTSLLREFASYMGSGNLDEAARERLANAADAVKVTSDSPTVAAQAQRLEEVVRAVEQDFVMPAMSNAHAQLAYLQSRLLVHVLKRERIPFRAEEIAGAPDPDFQAVLDLERARRAMRGLSTQLVKEDVREMREVYDALTELGEAGEKFMAMTQRVSQQTSRPSGERPQRVSDADRIFNEAFRGLQTRAEVWRRFDSEVVKLREQVAEGKHSQEDVDREIENLRDLIVHRLAEIDL